QVAEEAVLPLLCQSLEASSGYRLARYLERQLGEDQPPQCTARYVHAFPEGVGPEQDCIAGLAETSQQQIATAVALDQDRESGPEHRLQRGSGAPQLGVRCEQHEDPAIRGPREVLHHVGDRCVVACGILSRIGYVVGNTEQALLGKVERRGEDLLHRDRGILTSETHPGCEEFELAAGGESCAGERYGLESIEQQFTQQWCEVERNCRKLRGAPLGSGALDPADVGDALARRPKYRAERITHRFKSPDHAAALEQQAIS